MLSPEAIILTLIPILFIAGGVIAQRSIQFTPGRGHWLWISSILIIAIVPRLPVDGHFFMGLEYEDAYIFTASARHLLLGPTPSVTSLHTQVCVLGSVADCQLTGSYGGHFITLPLLASVVQQLCGYHPYTISIINLIASLFSTVLLYFVTIRVAEHPACGAFASLVYVTCPAMAVFHTSGLAETASSLVVLVFVYAALRLFHSASPDYGLTRIALWITICSSFTLALLTKRENLALLIVPFMLLISWSRLPDARKWPLAGFALLAGSVATAITWGFNIPGIESDEALDIAAPTFSFEYGRRLIPLFVKACFTFNWFGIASVLFLIGVLVVFRRSQSRPGRLVILLLFCAYFTLYTMHYRSYYFVRYGHATPFGALRYLTNAFPLFAIVAGFGFHEVYRWLGRIKSRAQEYRRPVLIGICIVWAVISIVMARRLRIDWTETERENRIAPVIETLSLIQENQDIVITDLSVVFQVFGPPGTRLVDTYSVGHGISETIMRQTIAGGRRVFWLSRSVRPSDPDRERYPHFFEFLEDSRLGDCHELSGQYSLCRFYLD